MATAAKEATTVSSEGEVLKDDAVADTMDEEFDVVDENNKPVSKATRKQCHAEGLLHRSSHIFLFRSHTAVGQQTPCIEVLLQQRSEKKKVGPERWDLSVAEHLSAGEDYLEAIVRGLREELSLQIPDDSVVTVLEPYLSRQYYEEAGILDNMFTSTFAALYDERVHGRVRVDNAEVQAAEWWPVEKVIRETQRDESRFTRWVLIDLRKLDIVELGKRVVGEF